MFDHRHYVPILKGKLGEFGALAELDQTTRSAMTPLIEIPPIPWDFENDTPAKTIDDHLRKIPERLSASCTAHRAFVDFCFMDPSDRMGDGNHPLGHLFSMARPIGLQLVPVTGLQRDQSYNAAVTQIAATDHRGVCIRLDSNDLNSLPEWGSELETLTTQLGVPIPDCDLILDAGSMSPAIKDTLTLVLVATIRMIPHLGTWRSFSVAASAFPENLAALSANTVQLVPRSEWDMWRTIIAGPHGLRRLPTFADYAIAHPDPSEVDPRIMRMSASIRYTADRDWLIVKGADTRKYGYGQFNQLCATLVTLPEFSGRSFSWGDHFFDDCANGGAGPGNAMTWRKAGTSHHLAFVVDQIAKLP